jgi:hypothetical protein
MYSVTRGLKLPTYRWALFGASAAEMALIWFILYSIIERDDKRGRERNGTRENEPRLDEEKVEKRKQRNRGIERQRERKRERQRERETRPTHTGDSTQD